MEIHLFFMMDGSNEGEISFRKAKVNSKISNLSIDPILMCWFNRSLDFDKRERELDENPEAKFDGEKFIHDNLNNAGPYSDITNDNSFSWVNPSNFGKGHWDYDRFH
jgi:hypothetical protein